MINKGKVNLLGVGIDVVDYSAATAKILECAHKQCRCIVTALAVHGLVTAARDSTHRARLNAFDLTVPDGQPVRWAINLIHGTELHDRVYGPKLTVFVCEKAAESGIPVYFYGSRAEVVQKLSARLLERFPALQIVGYQPSRFRQLSAREQIILAQEIRASGAAILFVGLGCPRQEIFAYEMSHLLPMPILAVGAAFDYHSGMLREPPNIIQRLGLQWAYRLFQEPRRLWKRYLFTNAQFTLMFLLQWIRFWKPDDFEVRALSSKLP